MIRRQFLSGLLALAAPAIIRTPGLLMPIKTHVHRHRFWTVGGIDQYGQRWSAQLVGIDPMARETMLRLIREIKSEPPGLSFGGVPIWWDIAA